MTDHSGTILVVDDSPETLATLRAILEPRLHVIAVGAERDALAIVRGAPTPDLVLLDVAALEDCDNDFLSGLRADSRTSHIPVVILIPHADAEFEERAFECGAADVISRAIAPAVLLARVDNQLAASRRAAELASSEDRLRAVIDAAPEAILTVDGDGVVETMNVAGRRIFGYPAGADALPAVTDLIPDFFDAPFGEARPVEARRSDGATIPMELTLSRALFDHARLTVAFARDLSAQRAAEAHVQKLREERFGAVGGMAIALAHEINQPFLATVAYIQTARQLLKNEENSISDVEATLDLAAGQILRAGRIISHLREFAASGEPDKTFQRMHSLIEIALSFIMQEIDAAQIEVVLCLGAVDDRILADKVQLKQALVNLIRNARQAMSKSERRVLTISTLSLRERLRVEIADTGVGLSHDVREKLFEPFTTTKQYGMGVGLSITRSIIEAHYGEMWAGVNADGGATFSFTLPLARSRSAPE